MERFRNLTKLWQTAVGAVDADTNFRPIQSNPSCISQCASSTEYDYCPEDEGRESSEHSNIVPVVIAVGVVVGVLVIGLALYLYRKHQPESRVLRKSKFSSLSQNEAAISLTPTYEDQTEMFVRDRFESISCDPFHDE